VPLSGPILPVLLRFGMHGSSSIPSVNLDSISLANLNNVNPLCVSACFSNRIWAKLIKSSRNYLEFKRKEHPEKKSGIRNCEAISD
jgi:hypothetical protein